MRNLIFAVLLGAGCAGTVYSGSATATVYADMPDMIYIGPGIQVIADYDEPVFYTDGYYWRYYDNTWYRSHTYTGGWIYASPPRPLLRIDRPHQYVRYRPQGYVARRPARDRGTWDRGPVIRDHRDTRTDERRPPPTAPRSMPAPERRDQPRGMRTDERRPPPTTIPRPMPAPERRDQPRDTRTDERRPPPTTAPPAPERRDQPRDTRTDERRPPPTTAPPARERRDQPRGDRDGDRGDRGRQDRDREGRPVPRDRR